MANIQEVAEELCRLTAKEVNDGHRRQQPILGNMRPLRQEVQSQGAPMQADQLDQPQEDLPF